MQTPSKGTLISWLAGLAPYVCILMWTGLAMFINDEWYYNPISFVDHAVYLGWSLNPIAYRAIYPAFPSGDLIPLIFPNAAFYSLLSPLHANFAIKFISFFLCNACLFFLVRRIFSFSSALFCVLLFSCYRYTLVALGADYTDGRVILYFLLASSFGLAAATCQPCASGRWDFKRYSLFAISGFFAQMMFSTAILSITLLPLILGFSTIGEDWRNFWKASSKTIIQLASLALGFALGFGALCLLDATIYGGNGYYIGNSIRKMLSFMGQNRVHMQSWHSISSWLILPIVAVPSCLAMMALLAVKDAEYAAFSVKQMALAILGLAALSTFSGYVILQIRFSQETLSNFTYFNFTIPLIFLMLGAPFHYLAKQIRLPLLAFLLIASAIASLLILAETDHSPILEKQLIAFAGSPDFAINAGLTLLAISLLAICCGLSAFARAFALCLSLICINYESASALFRSQFHSNLRRDNFETVVKWVEISEKWDKGRKDYVWFNGQEPTGAAYLEMASASHMWCILNDQFPQLSNEKAAGMKNDIKARKNDGGLILFSLKPNAEELLATAMRAKGLPTKLVEKKQMNWARKQFTAYHFKISPP